MGGDADRRGRGAAATRQPGGCDRPLPAGGGGAVGARDPAPVGRADWPAIAQLYDALAAPTGSPVVEINRAIAIAETQGSEAGLAVLVAVAGDVRLADYQPYWARVPGC